MKYVIKLADIPFQVETKYNGTYNLARDYMSLDNPLFNISIDESDIEYERVSDLYNSPDDYLETLAVYRKFTNEASLYNTFLMHGSAISIDNNGFIFIAKSGIGKSTHTRLLKEYLKDRFEYINDDKPLIKLIDGVPYIYGTPWDGKHHLSTNKKVILKGIIILNRGNENKIDEVPKSYALPKLLSSIYLTKNPESKERVFNLFYSLLDNISIYELYCDMSENAPVTTFNKLKEKLW